MSVPFNPGTGPDVLAMLGRATYPRDGVDMATVDQATIMEEIERFGDRANIAYGLVSGRSLTVQAIDSTGRPVGDPCSTPADVVSTWRTHRDAGVAVPVGHHSGVSVIAIRANSHELWRAWLEEFNSVTTVRRGFDGESMPEHRALRELGRYGTLTESPTYTRPLMRARVFYGRQEGMAAAGEALKPVPADGPVTVVWMLDHRSHRDVASGAWVTERPAWKGRSLINGVTLLGPGDLVTVSPAESTGTRITGDLPPALDTSSSGVPALCDLLRITWK
jgi:hypothetical protein